MSSQGSGPQPGAALRAVVESAPFGMHFYRLEADGRLVFTGANPAADRILRVDNTAFVGRTIEDAFPPLVATEVPQRYRATARDGTAWHTEQITYDHDRIVGAYEVHAFQTAPGEMAAAFQDITSRKSAEEALRKSEERYRRLYASMTDAYAAVSMDGRIEEANEAFQRLVGYTLEELRSRTQEDLTPARWRGDELRVIREQVLTRGHSDVYEKEYRRKDGSVLPVELRTFLIRGDGGEPVGMWAIVRDIGERKAATEALRRSEARFRALTEKATDIVVVLDRQARIKFWSPSATEALGWQEADVMGRSVFEFIHPDDQSMAMAPFLERRESPGATGRVTVRYQHTNGSWRLIEALGRNLLEDPAVEGVVINTRDVTDQRRLEEQFRQAQKLESLGRLAGGVAHDFNNLLTVILSCAEALRQDTAQGAPATAEDVEEIRAAGERARDLTRQLLAFARKQVIAPVQVDLNELVRRSEKLLRRVLGEDVELRVEADPELWPIRCDPGQVEQVLLNLVVNARDAMPGGGTLGIRTRNGCLCPDESAPKEQWVQLSVTDSGSGMSPDVKANIFEPFFTTKPQGKGTGLGLATVYGIVSQSGGHIRVDSEPGKGTSFEICFRRSTEAPAPALPEVSTRGLEAKSSAETILVVEDDPQVRAVTARSLQAAGYRVLVAGNAQEAVERVASEVGRVRLVVSDVILPGKSGRAAADELRRLEPSLRVLYVSGYSQDVISKAGVLERGMEFLPKPFTPSALLERVRRILDRDAK